MTDPLCTPFVLTGGAQVLTVPYMCKSSMYLYAKIRKARDGHVRLTPKTEASVKTDTVQCAKATKAHPMYQAALLLTRALEFKLVAPFGKGSLTTRDTNATRQ